MHRLAVVAECLLREALGITGCLRSLCLAVAEVFAVVGAPATAEHPVTIFHLMSHGYEHGPTRSAPVSELWESYFSFTRMVAECASH